MCVLVKIASILACVLSLLLVREISLLPDGKLHTYVLDVGQGDAIFIVTPSGKQILVDGGPDLSVLSHLGTHMPFLDRSIDLVILSHSDADHITALPEVLRRYRVDHILLSGDLNDSGRVDALLAALEDSDTQVHLSDPATDIVFDDGVVLDTVWPTKDAVDSGEYDSNDLSVVMRILYEGESILLTGDIEEKAEVGILRTGANIKSTVLKVPHHGSKTSSSSGFLLAVRPESALISVGKENRFGHPHKSVLDRFSALEIAVRTTAQEGTLTLE